MSVHDWSLTASTNQTADPAINWREGQLPSTINDSARAMMAAVAAWRDDMGGGATVGGSANAIVVTLSQPMRSLGHSIIAFTAAVSNTGAVTLKVDATAALPLRAASGVDLSAGDIIAGRRYFATLSADKTEWLVVGGGALKSYVDAADAANAASASAASSAAASAQATATNAVPMAGGTMTGALVLSGDPTLALHAATKQYADGVAGLVTPIAPYGNLAITVTSNTAATVTADTCVCETAAHVAYNFRSVNVTINATTTGAAGMDTGSIGTSRWLAVWVIGKSDGTSSAVLSASFTAPTLPSGYAYYSRRGAVYVDASGYLMRTVQRGPDAQYVVTAATNTAALPTIASGVQAGWRTVAISGFAPQTSVSINASVVSIGAYDTLLAPNSAYSSAPAAPYPPLLTRAGVVGNTLGLMSNSGQMMLESSNVYYAAGGASCAAYCIGWRDNI